MKVFVVGAFYLPSFRDLYESRGHSVCDSLYDADLVQFTGGSDVTPYMYGELEHRSTCNDPSRDMEESNLFSIVKNASIPMVGVCRGSQFLNVMCGGKLYQDVDRHAGGLHEMFTSDGDCLLVNSTHHQMMRPSPKATILGTAKRSTRKVTMEGDIEKAVTDDPIDIESVYYDGVLCVQYHPEFGNCPANAVDWFFNQIEGRLCVA